MPTFDQMPVFDQTVVSAPDLSHVETWVFDLDNTLYHPSTCDLFPHMDRRINEFICTLLKIDTGEANRLRQDLWRSYGTTLRGLMETHGLRPDEFLDYVHDIDLSILRPNPELDAVLDRLPGRKIVFTNATEKHAAKVLDRLGVASHFEAVFDVAAAHYVPKPQAAVYDAFCRRHGVDPRAAAMFEDMACNLAPAAALGMTTVWVRTDRPNAQMREGDAHIHHVAEELASWLRTARVAERAAALADGLARPRSGAAAP